MDDDSLPAKESVNLSRHLGIRPYCACCGGGEVRGKSGKYKHTKLASRMQTRKHLRAKPKSKDHR